MSTDDVQQVPLLNGNPSATYSNGQSSHQHEGKNQNSKGAIKKNRDYNRRNGATYTNRNATYRNNDTVETKEGRYDRKSKNRGSYNDYSGNKMHFNDYQGRYQNGYKNSYVKYNSDYFNQKPFHESDSYRRNGMQYSAINNFNNYSKHGATFPSNSNVNFHEGAVSNYKNEVPYELNSNKSYNSYRRNYGEKNFSYNHRYSHKNNHRFKNNKEDVKTKNGREKTTKKGDFANQRDRLEEMIKRRTLECLVCCEILKHSDKVWSCQQCYHILHLKCVQAWANSSKLDLGWRCPACQNICKEIPKKYSCFCGKMNEPKIDPTLIPHSCGEVCLKATRQCNHACTIMCHPGPCPECIAMVAKPCGCGKTTQQVKCSSDVELVCKEICDKFLSCGLHKCTKLCHVGECDPCTIMLQQECYCGKEGRKIACSADFNGEKAYSCQNICDNILSCKNHKCSDICHIGDCLPCEKDISLVTTCPCGKTPLEPIRKSCLDPIPTCEKMCAKVLECGQPNRPHICESKCHLGSCPPCPLTTFLKCRCSFMDKEIPCRQLTTKADDARCEKKCTKKRLCGKHKCNQKCCIEIDHFCPLPCNQRLSCGKHRCERTCHSGRCPSCIETSFDELYCECGASVLYPPVPCGTKPPACDKPCVRERECGHESNHNCHTGPCPPCTVLCKRWCFGNHEQRSAVPCHQDNFSCGLPCGKPMPCNRHKCSKPCHLEKCPVPCKQPCTIPRSLCGHICGVPCHEPPCPETNCKGKVAVSCICGVQKGVRQCSEMADEFRSIQMAALSEKMSTLSKEQTISIKDVGNPNPPDILKILECTEECRLIERNRRIAIGLQIRNPDLSQKLTPRYSDFMRSWAKKDSIFCQKIHDKLTELVQLAKQSKQKSRSYSFESMNRDKRQFVHEYCEHFGCESAAYDMEPNRNIVATAIKEKSWLPSMSLMEVLLRESGQRKVPGPSGLNRNVNAKSETFGFKPLGKSVSSERTVKNN